MTIEEIYAHQTEQGYREMQSLIETGNVWGFEGSMGRAAMSCLESGQCFLPEAATRDFYGNIIPGRGQLKPGSKGTLENSIEYYTQNAW